MGSEGNHSVGVEPRKESGIEIGITGGNTMGIRRSKRDGAAEACGGSFSNTSDGEAPEKQFASTGRASVGRRLLPLVQGHVAQPVYYPVHFIRSRAAAALGRDVCR